MLNKKILFSAFLAFCLTLPGMGQKQDIQFGQLGTLPRQDEAMQKFRTNRFGQFIHWGLFAIPAGIWNGKSYPGACEMLQQSAKITPEEWAKLKNDFNPKKYNASEWAEYASKMGAKYATLTTKHHDGFSLWPSQYTDFDMESTPGKRDLVGEFVKAYNEKGIDVFLYYSLLDWHHPDWRYRLNTKSDSIAFDRYKTFARNQLLELAKRYPTIKGFWFDGTWDESWKKNGRFSYELEKELKELHPDLIVNSRMRADEQGARHFDSNGELMGDYESGYERRLPSPYDKIVPTRDWEAVMTISEDRWGYHKNWVGHVKSPNELIEMLVRCVALNGNFLLNFGPKADGTYREEEVNLFNEIGNWMHTYGEAIYHCGYAGLERQDWGYYTTRKNSNKINLIVFNVPVNNMLHVKLEKGMKVAKAKFTNESGQIFIDESVNGEYFLHLPKRSYNQPFVIEIKIQSLDEKSNTYIAPLI